jgi:two-component system chemotaxis response regulator CheB
MPFNLIGIGASAGGVEALRQVVGGLPKNLKAAVVVVLHIPPTRFSHLSEILARTSVLTVQPAKDGDRLQAGRIYVAPPDQHVVVQGRRLNLLRGPRENGHRPAIDPLFRSAAASGNRVAGVILSGTMDDGSAGLFAVKQAGGLAIVQDPEEAAFSEMPRRAIESTNVDKILPLDQIAVALSAWSALGATRAQKKRGKPMRKLKIQDSEDGAARQKSPPSVFTCPDCSGTLWADKKGQLTRFVCRVGHSYTLDYLESKKTDELETALWISLRTLEERSDLQRRLAEEARGRQLMEVAKSYDAQARLMRTHATRVRELLAHTEKS